MRPLKGTVLGPGWRLLRTSVPARIERVHGLTGFACPRAATQRLPRRTPGAFRRIAIVTLAGAFRVNLKLVPRTAFAMTGVGSVPTRKRALATAALVTCGITAGTTVSVWKSAS